MSASLRCRWRRISMRKPQRQKSASWLLLLGHKVNSTAHNRSPCVRYGLAGKHGIESIAEIGCGHDRSALVKVFDAIVDAAKIEHLSRARKHRHFRRCRRSGELYQELLRVEQDGERESEIPGMAANLRFPDSRVGLHGVERDAAIPIGLADAVHLRNIAVAERAVRGGEENHNRLRLGPFLLTVYCALRISQGKLRRRHDQGCCCHAPGFCSMRHDSSAAQAYDPSSGLTNKR